MKLPGDPWNNGWSSFYGVAWNFSIDFHGKCPNPPWKILMEKFPWNSMEIGVQILHGIPWKMSQDSMEIFSMEIDALILHGIPRRFFTGNRASVCTVYSTFSLCF